MALPSLSEICLGFPEDGEAHSNSQKGINIAIIDAGFGSVLRLRPADKYKMSELKGKSKCFSLVYCAMHVFLKNLEAWKSFP